MFSFYGVSQCVSDAHGMTPIDFVDLPFIRTYSCHDNGLLEAYDIVEVEFKLGEHIRKDMQQNSTRDSICSLLTLKRNPARSENRPGQVKVHYTHSAPCADVAWSGEWEGIAFDNCTDLVGQMPTACHLSEVVMRLCNTACDEHGHGSGVRRGCRG